MKASAALKMMGLAGALVSIGVFAADDSRTKDMNKGKADASFVEQAAMANVSEIKMSELAVSQSTNTAVRELAQQMIDDHTKAFDSLKEIAKNKGIMMPFDSVGSSGTTGSSNSKPSTGGTGASRGTGSQQGGSQPGVGGDMRSPNKGSSGSSGTGSSGTGSSDTMGNDKMGSSSGMNDNMAPPPESPSVSEPASSGERMGATDRMNTEPKNVYGQLNSESQKKYDELAKLTGEKFDKKYLGTIVDAHKKAIKLFEKESNSGQDSELKSFATNTLPTLKHHLDMAQNVENELKNAKKPSM